MAKTKKTRSLKNTSAVSGEAGDEKPLSRGEQTREKIVRAALGFFTKKGFYSTSFQEIADKCDITQPAIFIHFKTKIELLEAVRKFVSRSNHQYVDLASKRQANPYQSILSHCRANLEWATENLGEAQIIHLTYYYAFFDQHFSQIFPSVIGLGTERILSYVKVGVREKLFSPLLSEHEVATMIHEYLVGCFVRNLPARDSKKITAAELKRLDTFLKMVLGMA